MKRVLLTGAGGFVGHHAERLGLWLCRRGWHVLHEPGNCIRCGYRSHGGHVGEYAQWKAQGRV